MYGFAAISAHNGWSIAIVGASIVFTGLVFLSIAISRIHVVLTAWENRDAHVQRFRDSRRARKIHKITDAKLEEHNLLEVAQQFKLLADSMPHAFSLIKLIERAEKRGLYRPHSAANCLLRSKVVIPDGKGFFIWSQENYKKVVNKG